MPVIVLPTSCPLLPSKWLTVGATLCTAAPENMSNAFVSTDTRAKSSEPPDRVSWLEGATYNSDVELTKPAHRTVPSAVAFKVLTATRWSRSSWSSQNAAVLNNSSWATGAILNMSARPAWLPACL